MYTEMQSYLKLKGSYILKTRHVLCVSTSVTQLMFHQYSDSAQILVRTSSNCCMTHVIRAISASIFFSTGGTAFTKCHNEKPTGVKSGDLGGHTACNQGQRIFQRKVHTRV
jgi:hypothetical protein